MGKTKRKKKIRIGRIFRNLFLGIFLFCLLMGISGYVFIVKPEYEKLKVLAYDKLSSENIMNMTRLSDTVVYDKNGDQLGIINAGHFVYVSIDKISVNLQNAYIAQEDRNFKIHNGVDYKATLRAAVSLLKNRGKITQGGSTITQQLVKNTYLSSERTFTRKFVEMILAQELEKMYSKADIMELYCNINFYGNNCYGVEAASQYYFGKSAKDLTVPEAATLAGISNAPSRYEPVRHSEASLEKRNQVLASMLECGYIDEAEYREYRETPLSIVKNLQEETDEDYLNSYALHEAILSLMKQNDFTFEYLWDSEAKEEEYETRYSESYDYYSKEIRSGGYRIYTSLDPDAQEILQEELDQGLLSFTEVQENGKLALQGAITLVDNQSGYVVAVVGGRGTEDKYNRAFLSTRQPGSSIKPLLDYAPAMESGKYTPGTLIEDYKWEDGPSNSGDHYYGLITLREAVNRSLNTVAWQVLQEVGIENGLQYLTDMEFQGLSWKDRSAPAISIGGFTNGVTTESMARGYAALANDGKYRYDSCIIRIEHEKEGEILGDDQGYVQIYSQDTAYMMTDVLKDSIRMPYGTGRALALQNNMPCAGKTGTTNSSKDTWFCGYTKYYTMAVWVGYDQPKAMPGIYGATYAGTIWQSAMNRLHENLEILDWEKPDTVIEKTNVETGITDLISLNQTEDAFSIYVNAEEINIEESSESEEEVMPPTEDSEESETVFGPHIQVEEDMRTAAVPMESSSMPVLEQSVNEDRGWETQVEEQEEEIPETRAQSVESTEAETHTAAPETQGQATVAPVRTETSTQAATVPVTSSQTTVQQTTAASTTAAQTTAAPTTAPETTEREKVYPSVPETTGEKRYPSVAETTEWGQSSSGNYGNIVDRNIGAG